MKPNFLTAVANPLVPGYPKSSGYARSFLLPTILLLASLAAKQIQAAPSESKASPAEKEHSMPRPAPPTVRKLLEA